MKNSIRRKKKTYHYNLYLLDKVYTRKKIDEVYEILKRFGDMALNAHLRREAYWLNMSFTEKEWIIWYDEKILKKHNKFVLKRCLDYKHPKMHMENSSTKFFAFSEKVINLMGNIGDNGLTDNRLFRLLVLFHKRGFKDFIFEENDVYEKDYYTAYMDKYTIDTFEDWWYWSDRCNFLRTKVLVDMIKRDKPEVYKKFKEWKKIKYRVR